jgi:ATP-binding cassette subfamily B protein
MSEVSGKAFDIKLLGKVMRYVRPYRLLFVTGFLLTILLGAVATSRPILIKYTIDQFVVTPDAEGLLLYSLLMLFLLFVESGLQFAFIYAANFLGQSVIRDIRIQLYRHLIRFRLSYFDRTPIGTLVTRAVSDIETIANIFSEGLLVIFGDLFKIGVMVVAMFTFFSWPLVLMSLSVVPLLFLATRWFQRSIKGTFQDVRNEVARLNAFVQEHLGGMMIVQAFHREAAELEKFKEINRAHRDANIRSIWYFSIFLPIIEVLSAVSIGLVVWYGGWQSAMGGEVTFGDLTALLIFINMLFRPLRQLADRFNTLQMGMVASERVLKILDQEERIENSGDHTSFALTGAIEFRDVWFAYTDEHWVLQGVNIQVKPGETLAIVGATGAGKSTIINLVSRFYEIQKGQILLDERLHTEYELNALREQMAVVLQEVFLFSDTIHYNVTLGDDISMEKLEEAARLIGVQELIEKLPGGWQFNVRERGGTLSAGQRQLISFLRAYVHDPKILILDEATSSIDSHSEELIQRATEKLTEDRTSIIIAHRLATIRRADRILVMDKGQVVEQGTHDDLLEKEGIYRKLYEMQFQTEATSS